MIRNIEELIIFIQNNQKQFDFTNMSSGDKSILFSLASQIRKNLSFTEKQANLLLRILTEHKNIFNEIENFSYLIEFPVYKDRFRIIDRIKTITVLEIDNQKYIAIRFPFDKKINHILQNTSVMKQTYNSQSKSYVSPLNKNNLISLLGNEELMSCGFQVSSQLTELYEKVKLISENGDEYLPLIDYDGTYILKNCSRSTEEYFNTNKTGNFVSDMFLAKSIGLKKSKNVIDKLKSPEIDKRLSKILLKKSNKFYLNNKDYDNSTVVSIIHQLDQFPVLIVLIDDENVDKNLENWHICFENFGIKNQEISVLFRSINNKSLNEYINLQKLNNLVGEETKVVFIKHKMPKILYKTNFSPKIVLSSSTFYAHFTTQKLLNSHPFVLFYTDQVKENNLAGIEVV